MANGNGTITGTVTDPQAAVQQPQQKKPSLFRQILAGALIGLAGGLGQDDFGSAFAGGFENVERQRNRELQRQLAQQEEQRRQKQLEIQQQQLELQRQTAESNIRVDEARLAQLNAQLAIAQRNFALLPEDRQQALEDDFRKSSTPLFARGELRIVAEGDDAAALNSRAVELLKENPRSKITLAIPHPTKEGEFVIAEQVEDTTKEPVTITVGKQKLTIPAGVPTTTVINAQLRAFEADLEAESREKAARIAASTRSTPEDRTGLEAVRQELTTLRSRLTQLSTDRRVLLRESTFAEGQKAEEIRQRIQAIDAEANQVNARIQQLTESLRGSGGTGAPQESVAALPDGNGRELDEATARLFLQAANGDKDLARRLAKSKGWTIPGEATTAPVPPAPKTASVSTGPLKP